MDARFEVGFCGLRENWQKIGYNKGIGSQARMTVAVRCRVICKLFRESVMKRFQALVVLSVALLTSACALRPVQPGMSQAEVLKLKGTPTRTVPLGSGTRLQYSTEPAGQSVVMVDLDAQGKVINARQVMTLAEFSKIQPGQWTREDVEREFGRPALMDRVASWPGEIMTYRWLDSNIYDMYFWVYLDAGNVVQRTGQGMEFPARMKDND